VRSEIHIAPQPFAEDATGYFCTQFRAGRTVMGSDWSLFEGQGSGWFLGAVQTMVGGHYCEGDEHFSIDGASMPQINGTGTEDYYLACYWPNANFNLPFSGCVGNVLAEGGGTLEGAYAQRACYYRFHLEAPIPFYSGIEARIQHGPASDIVSEYSSLGFAYMRKRPALTLTDFVDVSNPESERIHDYVATDGPITDELAASYEGEHLDVVVRDRGRRHPGGEIRFSMAIRPDNSGVRLRRRLDQASPRQHAQVYLNGEFAGSWYHADENPYLRWYDSDFDADERFTHGRDQLDVRLVVDGSDGHGPFTDFRYEAFTFEQRSGRLS
jgi:hypothetical protein